MPVRYLIVDGYNLMYAAGLAPLTQRERGLEASRTALLAFLAERLTAAEAARTTVIFDARQPPPGLPSVLRSRGLTVVFPRPHGDADEAITDLVHTHSAPRQITVVSSDHTVQKLARRRRAEVVDSEDFVEWLAERPTEAERLHRRRATAEPSAKYDAPTSHSELEHWLKVFGDIAEPAPEPHDDLPATFPSTSSPDATSLPKNPAAPAVRKVPPQPTAKKAPPHRGGSGRSTTRSKKPPVLTDEAMLAMLPGAAPAAPDQRTSATPTAIEPPRAAEPRENAVGAAPTVPKPSQPASPQTPNTVPLIDRDDDDGSLAFWMRLFADLCGP